MTRGLPLERFYQNNIYFSKYKNDYFIADKNYIQYLLIQRTSNLVKKKKKKNS